MDIKGQHNTAQSTEKTQEDAKSRPFPHGHDGVGGPRCGSKRASEPRQHGDWSQESQESSPKATLLKLPCMLGRLYKTAMALPVTLPTYLNSPYWKRTFCELLAPNYEGCLRWGFDANTDHRFCSKTEEEGSVLELCASQASGIQEEKAPLARWAQARSETNKERHHLSAAST